MSIRSANSTRLGRKMPSRSSATAFDRLAPDQRAAVELVLRQGRSYGELADLLGMPEETIRARARNGLAGLAPDLLPPTRAGEIADWLLGQQSEAHAARTRALLLADPAAQTWAATVAEPLRAAPGGESVPGAADRARRGGAAGERDERAPPADETRGDAARPRRRARDAARATPRATRAAAAPARATRADGRRRRRRAVRAAAPRGSAARSSSARRCMLVAAVLVFVFTRGDDEPDPAADAPARPRPPRRRPRPRPTTSCSRARRARRRSG